MLSALEKGAPLVPKGGRGGLSNPANSPNPGGRVLNACKVAIRLWEGGRPFALRRHPKSNFSQKRPRQAGVHLIVLIQGDFRSVRIRLCPAIGRLRISGCVSASCSPLHSGAVTGRLPADLLPSSVVGRHGEQTAEEAASSLVLAWPGAASNITKLSNQPWQTARR